MVGLLLVIMEAGHWHPIENNDSSIAEYSQVAMSSAFSKLDTSIRLKATLDETHAFTKKCIEEWNIWQRGWEVIVTQRLPRLKQEIFEQITMCMLETSVSRACSTGYNMNLTVLQKASTKNELRVKSDMQIEKLISIWQKLQELLTRADSTPEQMNNILQRLGQLQAEQRQRQDEQPINIRFPEGDARLEQISNLGNSQDLLASEGRWASHLQGDQE